MSLVYRYSLILMEKLSVTFINIVNCLYSETEKAIIQIFIIYAMSERHWMHHLVFVKYSLCSNFQRIVL